MAPGEHAVISLLLRRTRGKCKMVTDFFVNNSTPLVFGRGRHFDSRLDPGEAALTLRLVGGQTQRNSYVPNDGELGPVSATAFSRRDWLDLLTDLGEWCSFTPV